MEKVRALSAPSLCGLPRACACECAARSCGMRLTYARRDGRRPERCGSEIQKILSELKVTRVLLFAHCLRSARAGCYGRVRANSRRALAACVSPMLSATDAVQKHVGQKFISGLAVEGDKSSSALWRRSDIACASVSGGFGRLRCERGWFGRVAGAVCCMCFG